MPNLKSIVYTHENWAAYNKQKQKQKLKDMNNAKTKTNEKSKK